MFFNERYRGVIVWNRTRKVRDPETGNKTSKRRPQAEWKRIEVPQLRILSEELWARAHEQNTRKNQFGITRLGGMSRTPNSRTYLFSGMLVCGDCGSNIVIISGGGKRGYVKYGCHAHKHSGVCGNNWTIRRDRLEEQLLGAIEQRLFDPEMLEYAVSRCEQAVAAKLAELRRQAESFAEDAALKRREELRAQALRLTEAIGLGGNLPTLVEKLQDVEREIGAIDRAAAAARPRNMDLKEGQVREYVVKTLVQLRL